MSKKKEVEGFELYIPRIIEKKSKETRKIKKGEDKAYSPTGGNLDNPPQSGSGVPPKPPKDEDKKDNAEE